MSDRPSTEIAMRSVPCNLCGSDDTRTIRESTGEGRIVRCRRCQLTYVSPRIAWDPVLQYESDEYHEKGELATGRPGYTSYSSDRPVLSPYFGRIAAEIARVKPGGKVLEIGAASGFFLEQARAHGLDPAGIEPSRACQRIIREELGIPVLAGSLEEAAIPPGTFDAVALFQTIEHFDDPLAGLQKMASALKPGGLIVITTPNQAGWFARIARRRWYEYKPKEHLYYFTPRTLARMLEAAGFERIEAKIDPNRYPVAFLIERISRYYPVARPVMRVLDRLLPKSLQGRLYLPVHYGSMKVTARRAGMA